MRSNYTKREMVSFDGRCPLQCKYCYTYDLQENFQHRSIEELVCSIDEKEFDILYFSQTYENFWVQKEGLYFCEELYRKYKKDIFIITKSLLNDNSILRLADLNRQMKNNGNQLYLGVSVCANESYGEVEQKGLCPSPIERISNLERGYRQGIKTLLLLRPIFPDNIVPVRECLDLIGRIKSEVCAVVSSGLITTPNNLKELRLERESLRYLENGDSNYLANIEREKVSFVNVEDELKIIQNYCQEQKIPFFRHSIPALNNIRDLIYN